MYRKNLDYLVTMGFEADDHYEPISTPKLSLSKLPYCKPREPSRYMQTPPLRPPVSIPFHWEEAPGKPRATTGAEELPFAASGTPPYSANRCLDLPPRLLHDDSVFAIMPSPTTVLNGPYVGRSLSLACTFSFRKGMSTAKRSGARNLGCGRWGSFKEEGKFGRDGFDFPHSLGDIFKSDDNVKARRVRWRRSFFSLSTTKAKYLLADIYASLKQRVPWRRRQ